jgi:hypothetical protein
MLEVGFEREARPHIQTWETQAAGRRSTKYGDVATQVDYQAARDEFSRTLSRLASTHQFSTSETVTPQIAKKQGEAWLAYLEKKAKGS